MYPELNHFKQMKKEYDVEIAKVNEKWTLLHKQKEWTSNEYEELLNAYGVRNSRVTMEHLAESKNKYLKALEKEREAMEELDQLKDSREDRLTEYLKTVYVSRDRELSVAQNSITKKIEQLESLKAEYLMMVQQIQEIHSYRLAVEKETSDAISDEKQAYTPKEVLPLYPEMTRMEIPLHDIQYVFQKGELPEHLKRYVQFNDRLK
jgi:hypothetical protein